MFRLVLLMWFFFLLVDFIVSGGYCGLLWLNLIFVFNLFWLVGVVVIVLLFDGGQCWFVSDQVCVVVDVVMVNYCQVVLMVFQEVEDNFVDFVEFGVVFVL